MNEINKGAFEEIKELDEEQNYSSGFNSGRSKEEANFEQKYSQIKDSIVYEQKENELSEQFDSGREELPVVSLRAGSLSDNSFDEDRMDEEGRDSIEDALEERFSGNQSNDHFGSSDSDDSDNSSNRSIGETKIFGNRNGVEFIGVKDSSGIDQLDIEKLSDTERKSISEEDQIERRPSNQELTNTPLVDQSTNNLDLFIYLIL